MCSYTMGADGTTRRICGSMAGRAAAWCSSSNWGVDARDRSVSSANTRAFYKPTAMAPMTGWAGRGWCMLPVGRTRAGNSSKRRNSIPATSPPCKLWSGSTNCSGSTDWRGSGVWITRHATNCGDSSLSRCWKRFVRRSKRRGRWRCLRVHWARLRSTRSLCGRG